MHLASILSSPLYNYLSRYDPSQFCLFPLCLLLILGLTEFDPSNLAAHRLWKRLDKFNLRHQVSRNSVVSRLGGQVRRIIPPLAGTCTVRPSA
jgi:hypothetical protein